MLTVLINFFVYFDYTGKRKIDFFRIFLIICLAIVTIQAILVMYLFYRDWNLLQFVK